MNQAGFQELPLAAPLPPASFSFDRASGRFTADLDGLSLPTPAAVKALHAAMDSWLTAAGPGAEVVLRFDELQLCPAAVDTWLDMMDHLHSTRSVVVAARAGSRVIPSPPSR